MFCVNVECSLTFRKIVIKNCLWRKIMLLPILIRKFPTRIGMCTLRANLNIARHHGWDTSNNDLLCFRVSRQFW